MRKAICNLLTTHEELIEYLLLRLTLLLLFIYFLGLFLTIVKQHNIYILLLPLLIGGIFLYITTTALVNYKQLGIKKNIVDYLVLGIIFIFCLFNSFYFSEQLVEGGHDQGTYLESAVYLARYHHLFINPSQEAFVHTFPAWTLDQENRTKLGFLPGNTVFLSTFVSLFGISGINFANNFILFFSTSIIYFLIKKIKSWRVAIVWVIFFLFNYYTIFFSRATYVENLQLLFTWTYIYLFIEGFRRKSLKIILLSSIPLVALMSIRLEAFLYVGVYFLIVTILIIKKYLQFTRRDILIYVSVIIFNLAVLTALAFHDPQFLSPALSFISSNQKSANIANTSSGIIPYNQQLFIWVNIFHMFTPLLVFFAVLGTISLFYEPGKTKSQVLLIITLILPQFAFLIRPGIAFYLPWFMRRHWAVLIPFVLILISMLIFNKRLHESSPLKKISVFLVAIFVAVYLSTGLGLFFIKQGAGVISFEKNLASQFPEGSMVIFWDKFKYENYGPPLFFFYGTNVIFDRDPVLPPQYYAQLLKKYPQVYLVSSKDLTATLDHPYFGSHLQYVKTIYSDNFTSLSNRCDTRQFILKPETFESYRQIEELCDINNPSLTLSPDQIVASIYQLDPEYKDFFVSSFYDPSYKAELVELEK